MTTNEGPEAVLNAIAAAERIVVSSQSPLDGDSVGCEIALLSLVPAMHPGASIRAINEGLPPRVYRFLDGCEKLEVLEADGDAPATDLLIVLDCGDLGRFDFLPAKFAGTRVVNLDHHASNTGFGDVRWVAPDFASTGEQVMHLAQRAGLTVPKAAAEALYTAMVFDTGRFAYSNTRPETFRDAAILLESGVRPEAMFRALFRSKTRGALALMGFALNAMAFGAAGDAAWVTVRMADLETAGATYEDMEDLVNLPMSLEGMETALLFKELPRGRVKVSLRSDRWFDVADFARRYGGGGHVRASGMTVDGGIDDVVERVVQDLEVSMAAGRPAAAPGGGTKGTAE